MHTGSKIRCTCISTCCLRRLLGLGVLLAIDVGRARCRVAIQLLRSSIGLLDGMSDGDSFSQTLAELYHLDNNDIF